MSNALAPGMMSAERLEELTLTARMLRSQAVELWPEVNEQGQVHFGRAVMESAAEEIEKCLPLIDAQASRIAELERDVVDWTVRTGRHAGIADEAQARALAAESQLAAVRQHLQLAVDWMKGCVVSGGYPKWFDAAIRSLQPKDSET